MDQTGRQYTSSLICKTCDRRTHNAQTKSLDDTALPPSVPRGQDVLVKLLTQDERGAESVHRADTTNDLFRQRSRLGDMLERADCEFRHGAKHDTTGNHDDGKDGRHGQRQAPGSSIGEGETGDKGGSVHGRIGHFPIY